MILICPLCKEEQEANVIMQKDVASHASFLKCKHIIFNNSLIREAIRTSKHPPEKTIPENYTNNLINKALYDNTD